MKKLLVLVAAVLVSIGVTAQENKVQRELKSFLAFSAGPSFPVGDFASANENNENAGFAKTGVNFNLTYNYKFVKTSGVGVSAFYGFNNIDKKILQNVQGLDVDHFKYLGITAGPVFSHELGTKASVDFRLMGGVARANSPRMVYQGETILTEDWATAFAWNGGIDVRMDLTKKSFVVLRTDYFQTKPEFLVDIFNVSAEKGFQKITVLNITAGIGFKF
jgi:hypothetical protein